jgi:uncharacterized protein YukE
MEMTVTRQRIAFLRRAGATLREIAGYPVPPLLASLPQEVLKNYSTTYSRWLRRTSQRCIRLADNWERELRHAGKTARSNEEQEMQMSFNLQYLQLHNQMQNENRQFTMVSNVMKTKHDTVKNSISNVR